MDDGPEGPLQVTRVPIELLREDPRNPRTHDERNIAAVASSLASFGQRKPVVALPDGTVVAGNGTLQAARRLGWRTIAVSYLPFSDEARARAYAVADNRSSELASWDGALLYETLTELEAAEFSPGALGFEEADLRRLAPRPELAEVDTPSPPAQPVTKPGDLWVLGDHRLLCGDATSPADAERLMAGARAALIFTDPPYGVSYEAPSGRHDLIQGDDRRRDELTALLVPAFKLAAGHAADDAAFYIWHATSTRDDFTYALKVAGLQELQYLIWVKPAVVLGWSDYQWAHEPCIYAAKAGRKPAFYGDRSEPTVWRIAAGPARAQATVIGPGVVISDGGGAELYVSTRPPRKRLRHLRLAAGETVTLEVDNGQSTVWEVARDTTSPDHPTQKPVELARRAIVNSSRRGDVVLDPFLGSGSTLAAAEQLGRRCYGIEIEPAYCDVALERWEATSGGKARRT